MFIGRERELSNLTKLYKSDKFEFAVIYGRRRVGKTALINEFIKGKTAICFTGVETNAKQNLENFSKCILEYASGINADTTFNSFNLHWNTYSRLQRKKELYSLSTSILTLRAHQKVLLRRYNS